MEIDINPEKEVSKEEFKKVYFEHLGSGWTEEYWNKFFESEQNHKYFVRESDSIEANRMFMTSGKGIHRLYFLTEESEENFFSPG